MLDGKYFPSTFFGISAKMLHKLIISIFRFYFPQKAIDSILRKKYPSIDLRIISAAIIIHPRVSRIRSDRAQTTREILCCGFNNNRCPHL
ncbi:hypothetical protein D3C87_1315280 [compost metagenome]